MKNCWPQISHSHREAKQIILQSLNTFPEYFSFFWKFFNWISKIGRNKQANSFPKIDSVQYWQWCICKKSNTGVWFWSILKSNITSFATACIIDDWRHISSLNFILKLFSRHLVQNMFNIGREEIANPTLFQTETRHRRQTFECCSQDPWLVSVD